MYSIHVYNPFVIPIYRVIGQNELVLIAMSLVFN